MKEFSNVFDERGERRICSDSAEPEKQRMQFNVYFLGIGGIGMSALARYFLHEGRRVAGYDRVRSHLTDQIEAEGAVVHYEEDPAQIPVDFRDPATTIVVYTPAVPADHAELRWFRQNGFEIVKRSQMLGYLSQGKFVMAVAGTHGKTTTTTLVAWLNHRVTGGGSAFLGGISRNFSSNLVLGSGRRLAVEADEFDRSFLRLWPDVAVVTSADADHLDIYGTAEAYRESFEKFTSLIRPDGCLLIKKGINVTPRLQEGVKKYTYSVTEIADFYAENIRICDGNITFDFVGPEIRIPDVELGVPVKVNIENGVAAMAIAWLNGVKPEDLKKGMATFAGPRRRFDFHLKTDQVVLIDDYAHHPAELRQSILSVKELYAGRKVTGIFQPHLYTRTRDFAGDFAASLSLLDELILLDIYPAREEPIPGVSSRIIFDKVTIPSKTLCKKEELLDVVAAGKYEVVLMVGAGNIDRLVEPVKEILCKQIRKP